MSGELNVVSRTQQIIVDPATSSVAVINAGPPGPNTGVPGPPGVVQTVRGTAPITVDSSTPTSPLIAINNIFVQTGGITETAIGGLPAGPYQWPTPTREIVSYAPATTFYTAAGGALKAGIFGVSWYMSANVSDGNNLSMNIEMAGRPHIQTGSFVFAACGGYVEDYLLVGEHIKFTTYKHTGMAAFASTWVRFGLTYRPVNS